MTSTNIFHGVDDGRNSSRILKPPGGGQTDVLGLSAAPEAPAVRKTNQRNISSITEGTNSNNYTNPPKISSNGNNITPVPKEPEIKPANVTIKNGNSTAIENDKPITKVGPQPTSAQNQRVRVPPGGFSSGLW